MANPDLSHMKEKWKSSIVARSDSDKFTGGSLAPGYMANLDSKGLGPPGRFRVGRKVCYRVDLFIKWLESRSKTVE
jgi:hypothetical protein